MVHFIAFAAVSAFGVAVVVPHMPVPMAFNHGYELNDEYAYHNCQNKSNRYNRIKPIHLSIPPVYITIL
jgi:hypothetical protein